ncbi:Hypothetical_protein [Hexamita inflata]|uniref:Hypothetical_protein n=1 Tax=Hexamita inflata TaxID=28002 RepID=A0AA86RAS2_9EUKA|nr:Hypothetical protein HINF_LOCUS62181 [Hexamita inflata]
MNPNQEEKHITFNFGLGVESIKNEISTIFAKSKENLNSTNQLKLNVSQSTDNKEKTKCFQSFNFNLLDKNVTESVKNDIPTHFAQQNMDKTQATDNTIFQQNNFHLNKKDNSHIQFNLNSFYSFAQNTKQNEKVTVVGPRNAFLNQEEE